MAIRYQPKKVLKKMAPDKVVEKLVTKNLTVSKTAVTLLERSSILSKKELQRVALKVVKDYKKTYRDELAAGATKADALEDTLNKRRRMVQRIKNATVAEITTRVKQRYRGEWYTWLPSTAKSPDAKHRRKWNKRYRIGKGEQPGDRIGCQCGMEIHVDESSLDLE